MAWAAPIIHAVGDILTASDWNISSNDLSFLAGALGASVATSQTTASTSYTDLATAGPAVSLTTGVHALVLLTCNTSNTTANFGTGMSFAISGATTLAAASANAILLATSVAAWGIQGGACIYVAGLTPGVNTFTAKYEAVVGGTATFANRSITVIPLP